MCARGADTDSKLTESKVTGADLSSSTLKGSKVLFTNVKNKTLSGADHLGQNVEGERPAGELAASADGPRGGVDAGHSHGDPFEGEGEVIGDHVGGVAYASGVEGSGIVRKRSTRGGGDGEAVEMAPLIQGSPKM